MAVLPGLPGLEVTVYTHGRTAQEYDDPSGSGIYEVHQRSKAITKYIECKDNEPFGIHLKVTNEYPWGLENHDLSFAAVIDEIWAKGEICRQKDTEKEDWERDVSYRVVKNPNDSLRYVMQEFAFSTIINADHVTNGQHEADLVRMARLGSLEVRVYRTAVEEKRHAFVPTGEHPKEFIISREAKRGKLQTHGTKFTRTQPATRPRYIGCSILEEDDGPIATFRFKYRSRSALELGGIIPNPKNPLDCLVEISDDEKDSGKLRKARQIQRKLLSTSRQAGKEIKKEQNDHDDKFSLNSLRPPISKSSRVNRLIPLRARAKLEWQDDRSKLNPNYDRNNTKVMPSSVNIFTRRIAIKGIEKGGVCLGGEQRTSNVGRGAASSITKAPYGEADPRTKFRKVRFSIDDADVVPMARGTSNIHHPDTCDTALPSIEQGNDNTITRTGITENSKSDENRPQETSKAMFLADEKNPLSRITMNAKPPRRLGALDPRAKSIRTSSKAKHEHQALTKQDKDHLVGVETYNRGLQRLQELKQEYARVSGDIYRQLDTQHPPRHLDLPTPSPPIPDRVTRATGVLKTILLPPPPSRSHASTLNQAATVAPSRNSPPFVCPSVQTDADTLTKCEPGADVERGRPRVGKRKFSETDGLTTRLGYRRDSSTESYASALSQFDGD
ncbi:hypothetical protein NUW58_g1718 [Xylaria curta]|uniref:Uncharacterized protein n=1 Tax=Xylaria curta TaxID=42375 RepID=A0ACC1PLP5_9PEZI|nr:hypothetical protein NUW58_g1718 [Xylaria curta]